MSKNVGILGSGVVGQALASGFARSGYDVKIGTRSPEKLAGFLDEKGAGIQAVSTAEAAQADLLVLAVQWAYNVAKKVIDSAGPGNFKGKVLIDVTNPLLFTAPDRPPVPVLCYPESAGKQVQAWLPDSKVVKAFNFITAAYMANPQLKGGTLDFFLTGDDQAAKDTVAAIAGEWGWASVNDMGGIDKSWLLEGFALMWIHYGFLNNHWTHGFKLIRE